jgi:hypothetical protein
MLADRGTSGQTRYTGAAIQTSLMLRAAFKQALPQIGPDTYVLQFTSYCPG